MKEIQKPEIRDVTDKLVVAAMNAVPRERFVRDELRHEAYFDGPLPIGHGQTISQPYIVALMTEHAKLKPHFKVLEIGTGSGYQTAVLAEIVKDVYTIEVIKELSISAQSVLKELGYSNINFKIGDGHDGWQEHGPYDAVIVTAAPEKIPPALIDQLRVGGNMVIPVGAVHGVQELLKVKKPKEGEIQKEIICHVRFVPFIGENI